MTIDAPESRYPTVAEPIAGSNQRDDRPSDRTPTSNSVPPVSATLVRCARRALQRCEGFYLAFVRTIDIAADVLIFIGI